MNRNLLIALAVLCCSTSPGFSQDEIVHESTSGGWFRPGSWNSSFEAGLNGAEGNTNSFNLLAGFDLLRKTDVSDVGIGLDYAKTTVEGVDNQHFARLNSSFDRVFGESSPWSFFTRSTLLYDEFQGFDLRLNSNAGLGYKWWDSDVSMFRTRAGAGVSREYGGVSNEFVPEAVFGLDFRRKISERQKFNATVDYFPAWSDFQDYRLVTDLSWELLLDEATNLSLKLSALDTYDSTPDPGATANDLKYGLLLLWKK